MTPEQAAYIAGIIDGEGNIAISKRPPKPQCGEINPTFLDYVKIANTDRRMLEWVLCAVGYGSIYSERRRQAGCRQMHTYHISGPKMLDLLREVYPYLVIKKEQADCVFEFRKTYQSRNCRAGIPSDVLAAREGFVRRMTDLHSREFPRV